MANVKKRWGRPWTGELTINRKNDDELEVAIADLEARGFVVIRRGSNENEKKFYDRKYNSISNRAKFSDRDVYRNCWAVLRKKSA